MRVNIFQYVNGCLYLLLTFVLFLLGVHVYRFAISHFRNHSLLYTANFFILAFIFSLLICYNFTTLFLCNQIYWPTLKFLPWISCLERIFLVQDYKNTHVFFWYFYDKRWHPELVNLPLPPLKALFLVFCFYVNYAIWLKYNIWRYKYM